MLFNFAPYIILIYLFSTGIIFPQKQIEIKNLRSKFAKKENRIKFEFELKEFIDTSLSKPLIKENIKLYHHALNDASLYFIENNKVETAIKKVLLNYSHSGNRLLFRAIQTAYNLYPNNFYSEIDVIYYKTNNSSVFSAAAVYLLTSKSKASIISELHSRFQGYASDPILLMLDNYLSEKNDTLPPLEDLLKNDFNNKKTIVYSIQRKDRNYPGLTIIKSPNGKFVRNQDSTIFNIQQLALSASNFPGFLKNGNTPQGIYSIQKYYYSPTEEIGPSPILLSRIPFEIDAEKFYHGNIKNNKWDIEDYKSILPKSWKDYLPIYESYFAGQSGRRVVVAHGSADDPLFYKDKIYAPLTPTKGCLATKEIWDNRGRLIESDQVKLMNAFFSTGELYGYLVVIEINDKQQPVTMDELLPVINKCEQSSNGN